MQACQECRRRAQQARGRHNHRVLEKYGISEEQWEEGKLSRKKIAELSSLLRWSQGLTKLCLNDNKIVDVSGLTLTDGLTKLHLSANQIVDVSGLTLTEGLKTLDLNYNQIVDVSGLTLTEGLTKLHLSENQIVDMLSLIHI